MVIAEVNLERQLLFGERSVCEAIHTHMDYTVVERSFLQTGDMYGHAFGCAATEVGPGCEICMQHPTFAYKEKFVIVSMIMMIDCLSTSFTL